MPFTLSHAAAALPLRAAFGRRINAEALLLGTVMPDMAYFLPLGISRAESHSLAGFFLFCLPVGVLLLAAYFAVARRPLLGLLPEALAARLPPAFLEPPALSPPGRIPRALAAMLAGLCLGTASHLLWDAFTHEGAAADVLLAPLRAELSAFALALPAYIWLQHACSAAGLFVVATAAARRLRSAAPRALPSGHPLSPAAVRLWRLVLIALPPAAAVVQAAMTMARRGDSSPLLWLLFWLVFFGTKALLALAALYVASWWAFRLASRFRGVSGASRPPAGTGRSA